MEDRGRRAVGERSGSGVVLGVGGTPEGTRREPGGTTQPTRERTGPTVRVSGCGPCPPALTVPETRTCFARRPLETFPSPGKGHRTEGVGDRTRKVSLVL